MIKSMVDQIAALWLIPDTTVLTPSTMEYLAYFSLTNKIPIFGFSEKLLMHGAAAVVVFDIDDMGRQAAHIATRILEGVQAASIAVQEPAKVDLRLNYTVLKNLGLNGTDVPSRLQHKDIP